MDKASGAHPEDHPLWAPCLKRRDRKEGEARYFVTPARDVKAGYPLKTLTVPPNASEAECAEQCRKAWKEICAWRSGIETAKTDYTFGWLAGRFLHDEFSSYRRVKEGTQGDYRYMCRIITASIGKRHIDPLIANGKEQPRFTGSDVLRWHHEWGLPMPVLGPDGKQLQDPWSNPVTEPSAPQRQRHAIVMLRLLAKHAILINAPGALYLRDLLSEMEFPVPKPRTVAPTREQALAIVEQARKDGYRSIAITTLAQYELIERRIHIIGWWEGRPKTWRQGWDWANVDCRGPNPSWVVRYFQTKTGLNLREFDLKTVPALLALLQEIPEAERWGAVIIAERQRGKGIRQPWTERHYATVFRDIAQRAGVPDNVWSMDMRAGGTTEADDLEGVSDRMLDDAGGWKDPRTKGRYRREKQRNAGKVLQLRQDAVRTAGERSRGTSGNGSGRPDFEDGKDQ